jgi:predicted membrane protein
LTLLKGACSEDIQVCVHHHILGGLNMLSTLSIFAVIEVISAVIFSVVHGVGFSLAKCSNKPIFMKRFIIFVIWTLVVIAVSYVVNLFNLNILSLFDPIFKSAMSMAGETVQQNPNSAIRASKNIYISINGIILASTIIFLSISLAVSTKIIATAVSWADAAYAALWSCIILPGVPMLVAFGIAYARLPS